MSTLPFTPPSEPPVLGDDGLPRAVHLFGEDELIALHAALVIGRPLLVCGEPGTGKSQLARAAAKVLDRAFVHHTVDHHTEVRDLRWRVDNVSRLTNAQIASLPVGERGSGDWKDPRVLDNFIQPGALWWAFDWTEAQGFATRSGGSPCHHVAREHDHGNGVVVLIDEIDKADPAVPEGLLDALGQGGFNLPGGRRVKANEPAPLVIITTNETRALSPAFERRCLILRLELPEGAALVDFLVERGAAHEPEVDRELLQDCAALLVKDRAETPSPPRPGLAEYLDLVRAVQRIERREDNTLPRKKLLAKLARFTVGKHRVAR